MGRFGERIGSFEALAANLLFSTLIATTVLLLLRQSLPASARPSARPGGTGSAAAAWASSSC